MVWTLLKSCQTRSFNGQDKVMGELVNRCPRFPRCMSFLGLHRWPSSPVQESFLRGCVRRPNPYSRQCQAGPILSHSGSCFFHQWIKDQTGLLQRSPPFLKVHDPLNEGKGDLNGGSQAGIQMEVLVLITYIDHSGELLQQRKTRVYNQTCPWCLFLFL